MNRKYIALIFLAFLLAMAGFAAWISAIGNSPTICKTVPRLQLLSACLALSAAVFWLCSCLVKLPSTLGTFNNAGTMALCISLQKQGKFNSLAALCACLAALVQGGLAFAPTCIAGSIF